MKMSRVRSWLGLLHYSMYCGALNARYLLCFNYLSQALFLLRGE